MIGHRKGPRCDLKNASLEPKAGREVFAEVNPGSSLEQARLEVQKCLLCETTRCMEACPEGIDIPSTFKAMIEGIDALSDAIRTKVDLLNTVSHDARTPLSVIIGNVDLMNKGFFGPLAPELERRIQQLKRNSDDLLTMLNQVLSFSRLEAGGIPLHIEGFDLGDLVSELGADISVLAQAKGLEFHWGLEEDCSVRADRHKIKEVLYSLLTNAIRYTEKGHMSLRAGLEPEGDQIWFEVAGTRRGIREEELPYIFGPIRQVRHPSTRRRGGVGLGLAIVKRLLVLLGGRIEIKSTLNEGSKFKIILPRVFAPQTK